MWHRNHTAATTLVGALLVGIAALTPAAARAQAGGVADGGVELRPYVGAYLPTGDHRERLEDALFTGAQLGYRFTPFIALTGTFGWAPTTDKAVPAGPFASGGDENLDLFQYDLGVEGRLPGLLAIGAGGWDLTPFAALGAGGRTYHYRDLDDVDAETNVVGFGALGLDLAPAGGRWGLRLEARDHVSAFKGFRGELADREARNDVTLAAGLTIGFGGGGGTTTVSRR
jgi:hypothetical protein